MMDCLKKKKVKLATFLLQKEAEGWWVSIKVRKRDTDTMNWIVFRGIFKDKYYLKVCYETKRHGILRLRQNSLLMAE